MRVLVGLSGGVDSAVAAFLLKQKGFEPVAVNLMLAEKSENIGAANCAEFLGIEFHSIDMTDKFDKLVKEPFCRTYLEGETPNPCVTCNKFIKFGVMAELMQELNCEKLATGHYVRSCYDDVRKRWILKKGVDTKKDQSYFLWQLTQEQLSKTLFPLGELTKPEIREIAAREKIPCASNPESQDVCFVPDGDCSGFIAGFTGILPKCGDFVDKNGKVLGRHRGITAYTIGQRKGLGISSDAPLYVLSKNAGTNTVVLGRNDSLFSENVRVKDLNFIGIKSTDTEIPVEAKIRYSTNTAEAVLICEGDEGLLKFSQPQRAASPGQSAVFYDGDVVIGGGIIA